MAKSLRELTDEFKIAQDEFMHRYHPQDDVFDEDWRYDMMMVFAELQRIEAEIIAIGDDPANWSSTKAARH